MIKNRQKYHIDCGQCSANFLCLPKGLSDPELLKLNELITNFKEVDKGEYIFHAEDQMDYLYSVYTGSCKDYWVTENGHNRIDNFYLPGDIIGLESIPTRKHFFSLVALEESKLCMIPMDALFELMQKNDSILRRVLNLSSYKMINDQQVNASTNATQHLVDFILNMVYRLEERKKNINLVPLPMSQIDISLFLGVAHETVNRLLAKFQEENILNIKNKKIYVVDSEKLKSLGTPIAFFGQQGR